MLWRKMLRDFKENKGAYFACIVIITLGITVFTAFYTMVGTLRSSQYEFYKNQNFADGFVQIEAVPRNEIKRLEDIKGIKNVQGRLVKDVKVINDSGKENIYLRLISIDYDYTNPINDFFLIEGKRPDENSMAVSIDSKFCEAQHLKLNDEIEIVATGKMNKLKIIGVGSSPEFIYALRSKNDLFPSPETFGIAFIPIKAMEKLFPNEKTYNDIVFTMAQGADFDDIKDELETKLKPYGIKSIIARKEQLSHILLDEELKALESMSKAMPIMFLSIAGVITYITLKRLIEQQRGQIGILKAFGYTSGEILSHYLSYALVVGLAGGLMGVILGAILAYPLTTMYQFFFNLPGLKGNMPPSIIISGIGLSLTFSALAGYQGSKKVLTLEPAEAMRPPAPIVGRRVLLERLQFLWKRLNVQGLMAVRNISRNKGRSLFIFLGIVLCFAISSFTWSMNDLIQKIVFDQYEKVELYDVKINFEKPMNGKAVLRELQRFPGVNRAEPMAEVPVTLKNKWLKEDVVIIGIQGESRLYNIIDNSHSKINPPENGILLSERLAKLLKAEKGTELVVESPMMAGEEEKSIEVVGMIPQYVGVNAYMELESLQDFLRQKGFITSCILNINEKDISLLQHKYVHADTINTIEDRNEKLEKFQEMMTSFGSAIYIYALISVIIGFAIIYNASVITLSERSRELASMMVLGMTEKEVMTVITFEQWCIAIPAMILGVPVSKLMLAALSETLSNDIYTIPNGLTILSIILAFAVTSISIGIAQLTAARKIKKMSMVDVLKARE